MTIYNNIIITATNSAYFESLLTLISSIHKHFIDSIDKIYVFNLGLIEEEIYRLNNLLKVEVIEFSDNDKNSHPKFMDPKSYIYKIHCLKFSQSLANNILWIDSGAMFLQSGKEIFDIIQKDHIFLVGDVHLNRNYTHDDCIKYINATSSELNDTQLSAGILGYKSNGTFQYFIDEAYKYALIPGCVDGNQQNHRHDQSVLSILASRYSIKKHDIDRYAYWTSISRNLSTAITNNSVIFVHRKGHIDYKNLIHEN